MTPYDKDSVMHYVFDPSEVPDCVQVGSNYSDNGLTAFDRLGIHILYPEDARVAEIAGTTVIRTTEPLLLQSAWGVQGANLSFVARNFTWKLNGATLSTIPILVFFLPAGEHMLEFSHEDFLGRKYSYSAPVRVLTPADYDAQILAPLAAQSVLWP
jgi:hypothetical protein